MWHLDLFFKNFVNNTALQCNDSVSCQARWWLTISTVTIIIGAAMKTELCKILNGLILVYLLRLVFISLCTVFEYSCNTFLYLTYAISCLVTLHMCICNNCVCMYVRIIYWILLFTILINRSTATREHGGSTYRKSILPFLKPARGTRASQVRRQFVLFL